MNHLNDDELELIRGGQGHGEREIVTGAAVMAGAMVLALILVMVLILIAN